MQFKRTADGIACTLVPTLDQNHDNMPPEKHRDTTDVRSCLLAKSIIVLSLLCWQANTRELVKHYAVSMILSESVLTAARRAAKSSDHCSLRHVDAQQSRVNAAPKSIAAAAGEFGL